MVRRRNNDISTESAVIGLITVYWQAGAVISLLLALATYQTLSWSLVLNEKIEAATHSAFGVLKHIDWLFYLVPGLLGLSALFFVGVTFNTLKKNRVA
ncbi:hypothetical protein [Endozoicomonas numazuensis]|uniref:Uncharacterized protein n=1 Tax=Endozoicomonas numazuensis TaxID=1137799 RepID=A0A081MZB3_9GAMM|nr:hypothetical protein [Endozoicomonas numazuensis]KEQ11536.1 hypothetical protein GZ78_28750 [Endozoicomonas numazuensis]